MVEVTCTVSGLGSYNNVHCISDTKKKLTEFEPSLKFPNGNLSHSLKLEQIIQDLTDTSLYPNMYVNPNSAINGKSEGQLPRKY